MVEGLASGQISGQNGLISGSRRFGDFRKIGYFWPIFGWAILNFAVASQVFGQNGPKMRHFKVKIGQFWPKPSYNGVFGQNWVNFGLKMAILGHFGLFKGGCKALGQT